MWRVGGGGSRNTGKGRKVVYRRLKTEEGAIKEGAGTGSEEYRKPHATSSQIPIFASHASKRENNYNISPSLSHFSF